MGLVIEKERTHYANPNCCVAVSFLIDGAIRRASLSDALLKAIGRHEMLTCVVRQDEKGVAKYEHAAVSVPVTFEDASPNADWTDIVEREQKIPFFLEKDALLRVFVRMDENRARVVFFAHHLAGDALSYVFLAKDVCRCLADESLLLPPLPLRLFDKKSVPKSARLSPFLCVASRLTNRRWRKTGKVFSDAERINLYRRYWDQRSMRVCLAEIEGERLLSLISRCKEHGVTVNSAIVAAFLAETDTSQSVGLSVSLRPKDSEGMANFSTGISISCAYNHLLGFWENARAVHNAVYGQLQDDKKKYFLLNFMSSLDPTLIDAAYYAAYADYVNPIAVRARDMFGYGARGAKSFSFTNLTRLPVPSEYGPVRLTSFTVVPPLVPNASRMIGIATVGMRMSLSLTCEKGPDESKCVSAFDCAVLRLSTIKS